MPRKKRRRLRRKRVGKVSYYLHHGAWWVYYRDGERQVRRRVGESEEAADQLAAQVNAQLSAGAPTPFSFTPLTVGELRSRFLDHHEHVLRSSLATIRRYRAATQHLEDFANRAGRSTAAHEVRPDQFVRYLRTIKVAPNGHRNAARRRLRDKGVRFILEVCRSLYAFAAKNRHLPPYTDNPFGGLGGKRRAIEDAKPVFVFDADSELAFLQAADAWSFPVHFTLAKTGIRSGELTHLLIEDLDLEGGWMHIRNKPDLGWRIKTRRERSIPLAEEVALILRHVIGDRNAGLVFRRQRFDPRSHPLSSAARKQLARAIARQIAAAEEESDRVLSRSEEAKIARGVMQRAGAVKSDAIRQSFIRIASEVGLEDATCPKSWRHTFATLLQDAAVDPLIRQITLGHAPTGATEGALGMTSVYTHTRPETQRREIRRALQLWPASLEYAREWSQESAPH